MIEPSLLSWAGLLIAIVLSSWASLRISARMPWSATASQGLSFYFGLALAPFLLGFLTLLVLTLADDASHRLHLVLIIGGLVLLNLLLRRNPWPPRPPRAQPYTGWELATLAILLLAFAVLLFNTLFYPLIQNDPLEYATVGRALFTARSLAIYPLVQPDASGFYGPWTHPPLYVALIYCTHLLQGHADTPGLMRMISPWFALCNIGLIFALGQLINRRTGLFAALIFLATPLYFLGVASAMIDMLPILAFTMIVVSLIGLKENLFISFCCQGLIIGMGLWTHSQAILFLPLTFAGLILLQGLAGWKSILKQFAILLGVALLLGIWPFLRNLEMLGVLISDNPAVFALPVLDWGSYFSLSRGLGGTGAIIQYGVFKGWFAYESYGLIFWLLTAALIYFFCHTRWRTLRHALLHGQATPSDKLVWISLGILGAYLSGMVLSVLLHIDLMIRNERYMLVVLPYVALLGGWFLDRVTAASNRAWSWRSALLAAVLLIIVAHIAIFALFQWNRNFMQAPGDMLRPVSEKLLGRPEYRTIAYLREHTPKDTVVLSLKPADMYYANRRMISYLDPRLIDFYQQKDPRLASQMLKKLGIGYVHMPDYSLPPVYNSALQQILADPQFSRLEFSAEGNQVFSLTPAGLSGAPVDLMRGQDWIRNEQWILGGRKMLRLIKIRVRPFDINRASSLQLPYGLGQRDFSQMLLTGAENESLSYVKVKGNGYYSVRFLLAGKGSIALWLMQYDKNGQPLKSEAFLSYERQGLGGIVLNGEAEKLLQKSFRLLPDTAYIRFGLEHYGNSELTVRAAKLYPIREQR